MDFIILLGNSYNNGFKCAYCGRKMKFNDVSPYRELVSIDHYIPLDWNGTSTLDNLRACCVACNIVKGTMRGDTFELLFKAIGNTPLWDRMVNESFKGKYASKIERTEEDGNDTASTSK